MTADAENPRLVVGILLTAPGLTAGGAVRSIGRTELGKDVHVDVTVRGEGQTALDYAEALQARNVGSHILLLDESAFLPSIFFETVRSQINYLADRNVTWGVIGNSGITFPYFKPVRNMLVAGPPAERFSGVLPAAYLDPHILLIHREVRLGEFARASRCPTDAPVGDLATLAAWEAGRPCWICNLPIYLGSPPPNPAGDSGAWAHYLATRYNNASFVSAYGTIGLSGHTADAKDFYYSQVEPVLDQATRHLEDASVTVFLLATYDDPDIFDRCLMSIVAQFQRPETLYIIGLTQLDGSKLEEYREIVERYRHYLSIHWAEDELPEIAAVDQLEEYRRRVSYDGYSILAYDTFVLFPQAVQQIREFLRLTLRDAHVLPITTAELSRLQRSVETRFTSRPRTFFREVEKSGFTHRERWLSSEPSSTLHFTFPNRFLRDTPLCDLDLRDLGSSLPQRLLSEPLSFFLIERGAGYASIQTPSPDDTMSPLVEAGTPFHLANKAGSLLTARSNLIQYSWSADAIATALSYLPEDEALRRQQARLADLEAYQDRAEHELAGLRDLAERQEVSLDRFRNNWYFRNRRRLIEVVRSQRKRFRSSR